MGDRLRRRRLDLLARRGETIRQRVEIVVAVIVLLGLFAGRPLIAVGRLLLGLLRGGDEAEVMFRVLQITLRHDRIARRLRVACQLQVFLADVVRRPPDLHVRSV